MTLLAKSATEKLDIGEAFLDGFFTFFMVIAILAALCGAVKLYSWLINSPKVQGFFQKIIAKLKKTPVNEGEVAVISPASLAVQEENAGNYSAGELVLTETSEEEAAMIMAIVSDQTEIPLSELVFKSIKRI
jgi:hypothetical protein